jgi:hypothetical protein
MAGVIKNRCKVGSVNARNVLIKPTHPLYPSRRPGKTLKTGAKAPDDRILINESPRARKISNHNTHQFLRKMSRTARIEATTVCPKRQISIYE